MKDLGHSWWIEGQRIERGRRWDDVGQRESSGRDPVLAICSEGLWSNIGQQTVVGRFNRNE